MEITKKKLIDKLGKYKRVNLNYFCSKSETLIMFEYGNIYQAYKEIQAVKLENKTYIKKDYSLWDKDIQEYLGLTHSRIEEGIKKNIIGLII